MKKKYSRILIFLGSMLLISALILILFNIYEDRKSGKLSGEILSRLHEEIPEYSGDIGDISVPTENLFDEYKEFETVPEDETASSVEDTGLELDGNYYIGIISIPDLNIELPILRDWSYPNLKIAPCRYIGSAETGEMVIAAHNYRSHFGNLSSLNSGSIIKFTNISGKTFTYEIVQFESVGKYDLDTMKDGMGEEWDLTLFTCTLDGQRRVTVRAVMTDDRS